MTSKEIKIAYIEYESIDQLEAQDRKLAEAAIEATEGSYAPYSGFNVGAAVRLDNGEIIKDPIRKMPHTHQAYVQKGLQCSMLQPLILKTQLKL